MRLEAEFFVKDKQFPLDYRRVFIHFFKDFLSSENLGKNYEKYYSGTITKDFTFAVFFEGPQFTKEKIILDGNKVKVIFSTSDDMTGYIFLAGFLSKKNKKILLEDNNYMLLKQAKKINGMNTNKEKVIIRMNSPLVIREHFKDEKNDMYYSVASNEFEAKAQEIIKLQLKEAGFNEELVQGFKIQSLTSKKTVVKFYGCFVEASLGTFMLEGQSVVLNYLMQAGIGSRKSAGFGCAELLTDQL